MKEAWKTLPTLAAPGRGPITNVGVKPTIGTFAKNMETHIFNFDKELYGKQIRVEFIKMTRPEAKFASIGELCEQITRDCEEAKRYHGI